MNSAAKSRLIRKRSYDALAVPTKGRPGTRYLSSQPSLPYGKKQHMEEGKGIAVDAEIWMQVTDLD